jgi:lipopolysaccharide export system permease protein
MGILQRYVLWELVRTFTLVVLGLTMLLVIVGVVQEAVKNGLGPEQIFEILPYIVPSLLPFTIPATLLLTVCVVYGRIAGDQEITAIKSAGINVLTVIWPSFALAALLSLGTFFLTDRFIPWARANIERVITHAAEDIFLDMLRTRYQFSDTQRGIAISVKRIEDRRLISPVFRYTLPGGKSVTITARESTISFDLEKQQILLSLDDAYFETPDGKSATIAHHEYPFPLPVNLDPPKARDIPIEAIYGELARIASEREQMEQRQIIATAFTLSEGAYNRLSTETFKAYEFKRADALERYNKLNTEIHSRAALACSCFFFSLLGSPFAIMQGKRQFLTSFAVCFGPILLFYYPVVLITMTLGKDDRLDPAWGMWLGNLGMFIAGMVALRRVLRH